MKIGYVKIAKRKNCGYKDIFRNIIIVLKCMLNIVEQDKYRKEIFTVYNFNEKSKTKLIKKLQQEKVTYVLVENSFNIGFSKIEYGNSLVGMLPELIQKCYELVKPRIDEVYICTNNFCEKNIKIIQELIPRVKTLNIVTNNKKFHILERKLEDQGIYITVSNNKRKSLKNASIVVNLDFLNLNDYNINRYMVLIDTTGEICIQNGFEGIIITKIKINTKKVLRIFSEFSGFNKSELIEAEIAKINEYNKIRQFISFNKLYIDGFYNKSEIKLDEFSRIKKMSDKDTKKLKKSIDKFSKLV